MVQFQGNARPAWFVKPGAGLQIPQSQRDEHGGGENHFRYLDHPQRYNDYKSWTSEHLEHDGQYGGVEHGYS